jgi:hypothetical protein
MEIQIIDLLPDELSFYNSIPFSRKGTELSHEDIVKASEAAVLLVHSLISRKAIPETRIRYFFEPEYNTHSKKSHRQIFEMNGCSGDEIYKHPHFWPFLHYFIHGPDLPEETKERFIGIVGSESYISGSDIPGLRDFVRSETRKHELNPKAASEEFYKLSLECQIEEHLARLIRDYVHAIQ